MEIIKCLIARKYQNHLPGKNSAIMKHVVVITLVVKIFSFLSYGTTSLTNTYVLDDIKNVYLEKELVESKQNEVNLDIKPNVILLKGTLERKFHMPPTKNLIPVGTEMLKGTLVDSELQEAR